MTDSLANFIFAKHKDIDGGELYAKLREKGILVRHFNKDRISQYNRITVGSIEQMKALIKAISNILEEKKMKKMKMMMTRIYHLGKMMTMILLNLRPL